MSKYEITESALQEELILEQEIMEESSRKYLRDVQRLMESGNGGITATGSTLLRKMIVPYADDIKYFLDPPIKERGWNAGNKAHVRNYLKELSLDEYQISFTVIKTVMNCWMMRGHNLKLTDVSSRVITALKSNDDYSIFKKKQPLVFKLD